MINKCKVVIFLVTLFALYVNKLPASEYRQLETRTFILKEENNKIREFKIANVDGNPDVELITWESNKVTYTPFLFVYKDEGEVFWKESLREKNRIIYAHNLAVGDIDNDEISEIILYGIQLRTEPPLRPSFIVYKWKEQTFKREDYTFSAKLVRIGDVDNDGENEFVIVDHNRNKGILDVEGYTPSEIEVYKWNKSQPKLIQSLPLYTFISDLVIGDIDNNGKNEIITVEKSSGAMEKKFDFSRVKDAINIYEFDEKNKEIKKISSTNNIFNLDLTKYDIRYPELTGLDIVKIDTQNSLLLKGKRIPGKTNKIASFSKEDSTVKIDDRKRGFFSELNVWNYEIGDIDNDGVNELVENKKGKLLIYENLSKEMEKSDSIQPDTTKKK